ncbi:unnamed protein product [Auanema sp. JU1783]|nr:unnamed protein product [Auanema sp. JU1783]
MVIHCAKEWWNGRGCFIDIFRILLLDPCTGVPLGGLGSGSIGTDFRGAFNKFSIIPGIKEQNQLNIKANQFILTVRNSVNCVVFQSILSAADFSKTTLSSWSSCFIKNEIRYRGLFPRAWREFKVPDLDLTILQHQLSPVIPHNYEDSSLPLSLFDFLVFNNSDENYKVSITFTFRNGTGNTQWNKEGCCRSEYLESTNGNGIAIHHTVKQMPVTYVLATEKSENHSISRTQFNVNGNGAEIWEHLKDYGALYENKQTVERELGIAICNSFEVQAKSSETVTFSLIWYMPEVTFGLKARTYRRRYTSFYKDRNVLLEIMETGFNKKNDWVKQIENWQNPIIDDEKLPEWYRSALFNELYFVVDGSTVWFAYDSKWSDGEPDMGLATIEHFKKYGRYAYMESWEYFMFTTYDVHFYASWALLKNWPALEMGIQLDYGDQIYRSSDKTEKSMCEGQAMKAKKYGRTPHDLGHPLGEPFIATNAYLLHDTAEWRDLNLKFVALCWRDWDSIYEKMGYPKEKSIEVLKFFYERSKFIVESALVEWDLDKDGMIENSGTADQTYDVWTMTGTSSYCGSLFLCSLWCLIRMADKLERREDLSKYMDYLERAKAVFIKKLWNGRYFKFDENPDNSRCVMADQLCGFWFHRMLAVDDLVEDQMISSALDTIFKLNVMSFDNGRMGPVNGIRDDGVDDTSSIQSVEVWTGTAYALASFMIASNKLDQGFKTAEGVYQSCWYRFGLQYQTPEAIYRNNYYRAIGYMRPLSIWSMQESLEKKL